MSNERQVALVDVDPRVIPGLLSREREYTSTEVGEAVPKFEEVQYNSFIAKHGVVGRDLVVQFFLPKSGEEALRTGDTRLQRQWEFFWLERFRDLLSPVAKEYFRLEYPQLQAKYTEELASWWFRARGLGETVAPLVLAEGFERQLDAALTVQAGN
jgi:hypothetical protein